MHTREVHRNAPAHARAGIDTIGRVRIAARGQMRSQRQRRWPAGSHAYSRVLQGQKRAEEYSRVLTSSSGCGRGLTGGLKSTHGE